MKARTHLPLLAAFALLAAAPLHAQLAFQTVALSGTQAPGLPGGVLFGATFGFPVAGPGGVGFTNTLTGTGVGNGNDSSVWVGPVGGLSLLARELSTAPGTTGNYSSFVVASAPDALGRVGLYANLTGTGVTTANDTGYWWGAPGSVALAVREGAAAPGTGAGVTFLDLPTTVNFNTGGRMGFSSSLTGTGVTASNDTGLWSGTTAGVSLLAREGNTAPGTPATFSSFPFLGLKLNASGQALISGTLTGTGVTAANDNGMWFGTPGSVMLVAREGDAVPGMAGVNYGANVAETLNGAGQVAFVNALGDGRRAVFHGVPGALQVLALAGDAAPGAGAGVSYSIINNTGLLLNASGETLFRGLRAGPGITTANDSAMWLGTPGNVVQLFAEGDAAPGQGAGVLFGSAGSGNYALNDAGMVAFTIPLTGTDVTAANDRSLWWADGDGTLSLVVREGNAFEVAPGVFRTISAIADVTGTPGEDGGRGNLNDAGLLVFRLTFTDASEGVFTTQLVPEPTSALLLAAGGALMLARRRRAQG